MKLYFGCSSPYERRKGACEDEEQKAKMKVTYFQVAFIFDLKWSLEWKEERLTGKASRN
jgi:hypothetical protein